MYIQICIYVQINYTHRDGKTPLARSGRRAERVEGLEGVEGVEGVAAVVRQGRPDRIPRQSRIERSEGSRTGKTKKTVGDAPGYLPARRSPPRHGGPAPSSRSGLYPMIQNPAALEQPAQEPLLQLLRPEHGRS